MMPRDGITGSTRSWLSCARSSNSPPRISCSRASCTVSTTNASRTSSFSRLSLPLSSDFASCGSLYSERQRRRLFVARSPISPSPSVREPTPRVDRCREAHDEEERRRDREIDDRGRHKVVADADEDVARASCEREGDEADRLIHERCGDSE